VPVFRLLFILFLFVPLLEIYLLFQLSGLFGVMPTILLCVLTAMIGAALLRYQGIQTIYRVQTKLSQGEIPAIDLLGGVILLLSGALLLTPGFFTDCIGFLCLVPQFRNYLSARFLQYQLHNARVDSVHKNFTVDGEYWEEEKKQLHD